MLHFSHMIGVSNFSNSLCGSCYRLYISTQLSYDAQMKLKTGKQTLRSSGYCTVIGSSIQHVLEAAERHSATWTVPAESVQTDAYLWRQMALCNAIKRRVLHYNPFTVPTWQPVEQYRSCIGCQCWYYDLSDMLMAHS